MKRILVIIALCSPLLQQAKAMKKKPANWMMWFGKQFVGIPYAEWDCILQNNAGFCATSNEVHIIDDEENRRFLIWRIEKISRRSVLLVERISSTRP